MRVRLLARFRNAASFGCAREAQPKRNWRPEEETKKGNGLARRETRARWEAVRRQRQDSVRPRGWLASHDGSQGTCGWAGDGAAMSLRGGSVIEQEVARKEPADATDDGDPIEAADSGDCRAKGGQKRAMPRARKTLARKMGVPWEEKRLMAERDGIRDAELTLKTPLACRHRWMTEPQSMERFVSKEGEQDRPGMTKKHRRREFRWADIVTSESGCCPRRGGGCRRGRSAGVGKRRIGRGSREEGRERGHGKHPV